MLAVGWIEAGKPYSQGNLAPALTEKLVELTSTAVQQRKIGTMLGFHRCSVCKSEGHPPTRVEVFKHQMIDIGQKNLFIPAEGPYVYVAPSTIVHYVLKHNYLPPHEFQKAISDCPPMGSYEYYREMKKRRADVWSWVKFFQSVGIFS